MNRNLLSFKPINKAYHQLLLLRWQLRQNIYKPPSKHLSRRIPIPVVKLGVPPGPVPIIKFVTAAAEKGGIIGGPDIIGGAGGRTPGSFGTGVLGGVVLGGLPTNQFASRKPI